MPVEIHTGIVTNNTIGPDGLPFSKGEVMFQCFTLLSDGAEYSVPAVPTFMNADPEGFGVFFVPAVGASIDIEINSSNEYVLDEFVRYRGFLFNDVNDIPLEFKENYPFRKGFKFKSGIFMFDDTIGQELVQLTHLLGHGFELTFDGDVTWNSQRDYSITVIRNLLFTVLNEFIVTAGKKISLTTADQLDLIANLKATISSTVEAIISAPFVKLGSVAATEPMVLGNQLTSYLNDIVTYLNTHTHSGVETGVGSSGPPATAPPVPPAILSTKITGE